MIVSHLRVYTVHAKIIRTAIRVLVAMATLEQIAIQVFSLSLANNYNNIYS